MKKLTTNIEKNGNTKEIYVIVDEETAKALESVDASVRHQYICDEYEDFLLERKETRRHQSLDASIDGGYEFLDESSDMEESLIKQEDIDSLYAALSTLSVQQRWLVEEVYFKGRKQNEIASELGVDPTAIRNRLKKIIAKLKNNLI